MKQFDALLAFAKVITGNCISHQIGRITAVAVEGHKSPQASSEIPQCLRFWLMLSSNEGHNASFDDSTPSQDFDVSPLMLLGDEVRKAVVETHRRRNENAHLHVCSDR